MLIDHGEVGSRSRLKQRTYDGLTKADPKSASSMCSITQFIAASMPRRSKTVLKESENSKLVLHYISYVEL